MIFVVNKKEKFGVSVVIKVFKIEKISDMVKSCFVVNYCNSSLDIGMRILRISR